MQSGADLIQGRGWQARPACMPQALSFDLRSRVLAAIDAGLSCRQEPEEDERPFSPDEAGLTRFLQEKVEPWYDNKRQELENRPLLRSQALGQALEPERLQELARYEVHLDRKLERTLAMLLKLKDLRRSVEPA